METLSFYEEKLTLLLNINKEDIDLRKYQEVSRGFQEKSEFHITLIGNYGGRMIKNSINTSNLYYQYNAVEKLRALAFGTNWSYSFLNLAHKISKNYSETDKREAIIQIAEVPSLFKFYNDLNKMFNIRLEYPVEHVTLFTRGTDPEKSKMGIGINSEIEFFELSPICMNI